MKKQLNLKKISISVIALSFIACVLMDLYFVNIFRPFQYKWMLIGILLMWICGKNEWFFTKNYIFAIEYGLIFNLKIKLWYIYYKIC